MKHYSLINVSKAIDKLGMVLDVRQIEDIEEGLYRIGITQEQFDVLVISHAQIVKGLFTVSRYNYISRIYIALYFLGIIRVKKHGK